MAAVIIVGDAKQGVALNINPAFVLGYGIDQSVTGEPFARKGTTVDGLQQIQRAVRLVLHQQFCLADNLVRMSAAGA